MYFSKYVYYKKVNNDKHLFFNMLNNAVDLIENNNINLLNFNEINNYDPKTINYLIERGHIYNSIDEENELIAQLQEISKKVTSEEEYLHFYCGVTMECNLDCSYCFEREIGKQSVMTKETIDKMFMTIDKLCNFHEHIKKRELTFFGGEPLLTDNFITVNYIMDNLVKKNMESNFITNGVDLNHFIEFFRMNENNISTISITLDGPNNIHDKRRVFQSGEGSFEIISRNIDLFLSENLSTMLIIRINIDSKNYLSINELIDYIVRKGWFKKPIQLQFCKVEDNSEIGVDNIISNDHLMSFLGDIFNLYETNIVEKMKIKIKGIEKLNSVFNTDKLTLPMFNYCNTSNLYVFDPSGKLYVCPQSIGDLDNVVGEYTPYYNINIMELMKWQKLTVLDNKDCSKCMYWPVCGGGCRYSSLKNGGKKNKSTCRNIHAVVEKSVSDYISKII